MTTWVRDDLLYLPHADGTPPHYFAIYLVTYNSLDQRMMQTIGWKRATLEQAVTWRLLGNTPTHIWDDYNKASNSLH